MLFSSHASPLQCLSKPDCRLFPGVELWVKRDDLLHPQVSGNKFRKLKYPLQNVEAHRGNFAPTLISMGGPWSNHLHALAHAASLSGLSSMAFVRGLRAQGDELTATLKDCTALGMALQFVSREMYRRLRVEDLAWQELVSLLPLSSTTEALWLPEGGRSSLALKGMAELVDELDFVPETLVVACGTGTSLAGLVAGMQGRGRVLGIACVQNAHYLRQDVSDLLLASGYPAYQNFEILTGFEHGGFAKAPLALRTFTQEFSLQTQLEIEPIYTAKMFYALHQLASKNFFTKNERIVAVHTGGLQGLRGFV
ncbi:MAG: pyridoxal-phosphate dependent enzyme [Undibacterium sp.]|nr:pyridoxal-phosphate dependent enzyme [Undibacterium sp.]